MESQSLTECVKGVSMHEQAVEMDDFAEAAIAEKAENAAEAF